MTGLIVAILLGIVLAVGFGCTKEKPLPTPPVPTKLRTDLLFGYYGSFPSIDGAPSQLDETLDHVNLFMVSRWYGSESQISQGLDAVRNGMALLWDLPEAYETSHGVVGSFDPVSAEERVRNRLQELRSAGLLRHVVALYPIDEPDLDNVWTGDQLAATNIMIRRVMREFGVQIPIAVIYSANFTWPGVGSFDWVGFDNYDANIFTNGDYSRLRAATRLDQKLILVPGGCDKWRQDPTDYFNWAQADDRVVMLLPFVWRDDVDPARGATQGIRSNGMAPVYRNVGVQIKGVK